MSRTKVTIAATRNSASDESAAAGQQNIRRGKELGRTFKLVEADGHLEGKGRSEGGDSKTQSVDQLCYKYCEIFAYWKSRFVVLYKCFWQPVSRFCYIFVMRVTETASEPANQS